MKVRRSYPVWLFIAAFFVSFAGAIHASTMYAQAQIEDALNSEFMTKDGLLDEASLRNFYAAREYRPVWQGVWGGRRGVENFVEVLENSWTHGLNPATYHAEQIKSFLTEASGPAHVARLEILLSDAFARYAQDMSGMRINPADMGLDPEDWKSPFTTAQALAFLNEKRDPTGFIKSLAPKSDTYHALRRELIDLARGPGESYEHILPIDFGGRKLEPMQRHKRVPDLRLRLGVAPQTNDEYLYDDRLAAAVLKFQRAGGIEDDAVIGEATLKLLNQSNREKMRKLIVNLERLRWMDDKKPERFVLVNIPAATLWAIENNRVKLEMPVIVGRPERPTPSFVTDIVGVRFNPGWTVPPTIKRKDILPKLVKNPGYLNDKGMALIRYGESGARYVDPATIDWASISARELNRLEMVQAPGAHNPLGRVRILMPNQFDVYLHDTNQPEYFGKTLRAQSSGCIRMKDPDKMAAFIMDREEGWDQDQMNQILVRGKTVDKKIESSIPIYLVYYSAWVGSDGEISYGNDIYGNDRKLLDLLKRIDGFSIPAHNPGS